jgi:hypothetical protein
MESLGATLNAAAHLSERDSVSLALASKRYVPALRGAPVIDPSTPSLSPSGSFPATSAQAKMPDPPRARRVMRKGTPTSDGGGIAGVETIQGCRRIFSVNCFCVFFPAQFAGSSSGSRIST